MSSTEAGDELWSRLSGLTSRMDPVPVAVIAAAKHSLAWRDPDAQLAELLDRPALETAAVRGGEGPQLFTFGVGDLTIELEVDAGPHGAQLVGQLVPPQQAGITVDHARGTVNVEADQLGRFLATGITRGPVRLTCAFGQDGTHRTVQTAWTLI